MQKSEMGIAGLPFIVCQATYKVKRSFSVTVFSITVVFLWVSLIDVLINSEFLGSTTKNASTIPAKPANPAAIAKVNLGSNWLVKL